VLIAEDGKSALKIFKRKQSEIGLVIVELIIPEMSGKKCLRKLLKIDLDVKVIVSSGQSEAEERSETFLGSVRAYVNKSYDLRQLLKTVRRVLDS
jgi:two-component system cell cycle sensor histidine kinase/response regulator CckA